MTLLLPFLDTSLTYFLYTILQYLLKLCLVLSFCHYFGWTHRAIHIWLEWWLTSEVANGAPITIGSFEYNLWQGQIMAYNVLIHTPQQDEWNWSSPILARVGRIYLKVNLIGWMIHVLREKSLEEPPVDIYTLEVADVQVFLERQDQVFNFYLLDKSILLPDPPMMRNSSPASTVEQLQDTLRNDDDDEEEEETARTSSSSIPKKNATQQQQDDENEDKDEEQAQELVHHMLTTVQQLVSSPPNSWKGALDQQRHSLTTKLRELQSQPNKVTAVQQGVRVMRQVGEAVAKKTQDVSAPLRKSSIHDKVPMVRVGRIVLLDLRIFSREGHSTNNTLLGEWTKPIWIKTVVVRASELTPAMSALDDDHLAAIYQPIDKVMDVVWKRLLAESAKSQGDKLIHAAMSQVLGIVSSANTNVAKG